MPHPTTTSQMHFEKIIFDDLVCDNTVVHWEFLRSDFLHKLYVQPREIQLAEGKRELREKEIIHV